MSTAVGVPETLEEVLSPSWLTAALAPRFPGVEVTAVTPGPVVSRVSTNARFHIECAGGTPSGLSSDLCVKGYFTEAGRMYRGLGAIETCFYRDLAADTGMRTLRCVYADVDPRTSHGIVITEDVAARGATFLDGLSPYTADQVAMSLEQLAALHAATWNDARLAEASWLDPRLETYLLFRGETEIRSNFEGPIGAGVPDAVRDPDRLVSAYRTLAAAASVADPWCVIHGDPHVGNVWVDRDGRPSFVDWQLVQRGPWYLDVGYHIASALTVKDRRRSERDLVTHYLDRLTAAGGTPPADDSEVWTGVRRGFVHGLYLWGITLKVEPAVTAALLERLGTAVADHDAYAAVAT